MQQEAIALLRLTEKGAGQAMGLANRICEEELETTGEGAGADGAGEKKQGYFAITFFNKSQALKGVLNAHPVDFV